MAVGELEDQFLLLDEQEPSPQWESDLERLLQKASSSGAQSVARWCLMRLAVHAEVQAEYGTALVRWERLLGFNSDDRLSQLGMARVRARLGETAEAIALLEEIVAKGEQGEIARIADSMLCQLRGHSPRDSSAPVPLWSEFEKGDVGVLYDILSHAASLAEEDPNAAESEVHLLLDRARSLGAQDAVEACEFSLATDVIREPRRRIARCRLLLRRQLPERGRAHVLVALAIAEKELGWVSASTRHRDKARSLARGDAWCERSIERIWSAVQEPTLRAESDPRDEPDGH